MASERAAHASYGAATLPNGLSIVVHSGTLGDFVLTFPLLRALVACGPVWAVTAWSAARLAARRVPGVVAVDGDQPRWARLFGPQPLDDPELAERLAAAERVVSFVAGPQDPWAANVAARAPRARLAFVRPRPPLDWRAHVTEWFDSCLIDAGLPPGLALPGAAASRPSNAPGMRRSDGTGDAAAAARAGGPIARPIVLHPGSGSAAKCWPATSFEQLAAALRAEGGAVQVILGEAERSRWHELEIRRWRAALDVRLLDSLADLEALLGGAAAYVGNDSGPTHLAAEIGLPTVALFGPTSPALWRPIGRDVTVLAPPSPAAMDWLGVDVVRAAVAAAVDRADLDPAATPLAGPV